MMLEMAMPPSLTITSARALSPIRGTATAVSDPASAFETFLWQLKNVTTCGACPSACCLVFQTTTLVGSFTGLVGNNTVSYM